MQMNNQKHRSLNGSYSVPPLLASHDAILAEDHVWIVEQARRALECDAPMLLLVDTVLFTIHSNRTVIQNV